MGRSTTGIFESANGGRGARGASLGRHDSARSRCREGAPRNCERLHEAIDERGQGTVVDRAIEHLLAADASGALDVRVPVACTGLEMLGWAEGLEVHRDAKKTMQQVLKWADVSAMIPEVFDALIARRDRDHPGEDGPAVLNEVRNRLVHPPKTVSPQFPSTEELREAWQLATWYLELVVLRVLGYEGQYGSRLRLDRYDADVEHVPWSLEEGGG